MSTKSTEKHRINHPKMIYSMFLFVSSFHSFAKVIALAPISFKLNVANGFMDRSVFL